MVYAYSTQMAEVIVDVQTGEVEVTDFVAAFDVGKAINPLGVEGQIGGGVAMGLGYALMEEVVLKEGYIQNLNLQDFLIPTMLDVPKVRRHPGDEDQAGTLRSQRNGGDAQYPHGPGHHQRHRPCLRGTGPLLTGDPRKGLLGHAGSGQIARSIMLSKARGQASTFNKSIASSSLLQSVHVKC